MLIAVDFVNSLICEIDNFRTEVESLGTECPAEEIDVIDVDEEAGYTLHYDNGWNEYRMFVEYTEDGQFIAHNIETIK